MNIDDYIVKFGTDEDVDCLEASPKTKFILKNIPKDMRRCLCWTYVKICLETKNWSKIPTLGLDSIFDPKTNPLKAALFSKKVKLWFTHTATGPFQMLKNKQALLYCGAFDEFVYTTDSRYAIYMVIEPALIAGAYAIDFLLSTFRKAI